MALTDIPTGELASALREGEEASAAELLALVSSRDVKIRESLAAREDAPLTALLHLAQDGRASVREALAANAIIAEANSVITLLSQDRDIDVVLALVNNMAIEPLRLRIMLDHGKKKVREAVELRLAAR